MLEDKYLKKLKKSFDLNTAGRKSVDILLYSLALGEKLPKSLLDHRKKSSVFQNLRRYKFIRQTKDDNGLKYHLTPKGEKKLCTIVIDEVSVKKLKNWDGKWRLVMYDLPVRFKNARNAFRWKLKDLGFFQLQKSVWIYPYPCEEEILFVADFFGVKQHIEILEVNKILHDIKIKKYFNLV